MKWLKMYVIFSLFTLIFCQEVFDYRNPVDHLRRREQIPLNQINKQFNSHLNYRRTKDIRKADIIRKINVIPLGMNENKDKADIYEHSRAYCCLNRNEVIDRKGDEWNEKKREEIRDRRKINAKQREEELNRQRIDIMNMEQDEILDRRFEQSERELSRLDEAHDKLEELHNQLGWITINTDDGVSGIAF